MMAIMAVSELTAAKEDFTTPIPDLDVDGFLPAEIFDCTLEELASRFGGFHRTNKRIQLLGRLRDYLRELGRAFPDAEVLVNGSFVTGKDEPSDIDLIVVLPPGYDLTADFRPHERNLIEQRRVRRRWGFDVLAANYGSEARQKYVTVFHAVKEVPGATKGFLRVVDR